MHLFLVDSHSFGIHSIIPLLSLSHSRLSDEDQDPGQLAIVPGGPGGQRGVAPGAGQPGATGDEGDGQLRPGESHHLRLSHPRFDLIRGGREVILLQCVYVTTRHSLNQHPRQVTGH